MRVCVKCCVSFMPADRQSPPLSARRSCRRNWRYVSALAARLALVRVLEGVAWLRTKPGAVLVGSAFETAVADGRRLRMVMVLLMLSGGACCYWVAAEVAGATALAVRVSPRMLHCDNLWTRKKERCQQP